MIKPIFKIAILSILALPGVACAQASPPTDARAESPRGPKQALGLELYVYETRLAGDAREMASYLPEHLAYQLELERKGIMFGAGPLFDGDSGGGPPKAGMIIIRADSMDEARAIADADPMHKAGVRTYTMRKWHINEGSLQISLKFSAQDFTLD